MTHQDYLDIFDKFTSDVYSDNIPTSSEGEQGSIIAMKSYFEDFPKKLSTINETLVKKANELLTEASADTSINNEKLKDDFFSLVHKHHDKWIEKHKPKSSD